MTHVLVAPPEVLPVAVEAGGPPVAAPPVSQAEAECFLRIIQHSFVENAGYQQARALASTSVFATFRSSVFDCMLSSSFFALSRSVLVTALVMPIRTCQADGQRMRQRMRLAPIEQMRVPKAWLARPPTPAQLDDVAVQVGRGSAFVARVFVERFRPCDVKIQCLYCNAFVTNSRQP